MITGLALGLSLIVLGISVFRYGMGQPIYCEGGAFGGGCGNIPEVIGLVTTLAGLATTSGAIIYGVKVWEGSDSGLEED